MRRLIPAALLTALALAVPADASPKVQCKPGFQQFCAAICTVQRDICLARVG